MNSVLVANGMTVETLIPVPSNCGPVPLTSGITRRGELSEPDLAG